MQSNDAVIYADDTTISYSSKSIGELNANLNNNLHCLEDWLHGNNLTINVIKIHVNRKITSHASDARCLVIGDTVIEIVQSAKYLGVMVDQ